MLIANALLCCRQTCRSAQLSKRCDRRSSTPQVSQVPGHCWSVLSTTCLTAGPLGVYHWATCRLCSIRSSTPQVSHVTGHCWSVLSTAGLTAGPLRVYHWATGRRALSSISNQWSRPAPTCCSPTEQLPISSLQPTLQQRQLHEQNIATLFFRPCSEFTHIDSDNKFVYLQVYIRWHVPYRVNALYTHTDTHTHAHVSTHIGPAHTHVHALTTVQSGHVCEL